MNEIAVILENIRSQIGGELSIYYNQLHIKNGNVYVEIRNKNGGITLEIWVWTKTEGNPSLMIDLSNPEAIEKVVKHVQDYLQTVTN